MSRLDLLSYFNPISGKLSEVEKELERLLQSDVAVVDKLAAHVRGGKGKRLRPALVLLASRFVDYKGSDDVRFGAVFELIHTATLVHDDVIDHAQLRRGKPTLNRLWGNTLTVLFGDLLYLQAMSSAIQARKWRLMEILCDVTTRMIEGELIQNDVLYKLDTSRKDYFDIQERKTALLFSGCTETAGVLADRSLSECAALQKFGLEIGRAFQLTDDLLDFTATSEQLGKPAFSDLREGKLTLPMLTLMECAPDEVRPLIRTIWDRGEEVPIPAVEERQLRELIARHEALAETRKLAQKASQAAAEAIAGVPGDKKTLKLLQEIPEILLDRSK
ncbi:MAG: polyprenyl synthetase family protein [Holophaga sp.]